MSHVVLTAWKFHSPNSAEVASRMLRQLARQRLLVVHDAATVEWEAGAAIPTTAQLHPITDAGVLGAAFWDRLFGLLFFIPPHGEGMDAASRALTEVGIDDQFIKQVRHGITSGTSALFVMSSDAVVEKMQDAFAGQDTPELIFTGFSAERDLDRLLSQDR